MQNNINIQKNTFVILLLIILSGIAIRFYNIPHIQGRSPDEFNYTRQATIMSQKGVLQGLKENATEYNKNETLWDTPAPTRAGYTLLYHLFVKEHIGFNFLVGSLLSTFLSILSLVLITILAWRNTNPIITIYSVFLYSLSPIVLIVATRVWMDALIESYSIFTIVIATEIMRSKNLHRYLIPIFALLSGFSVFIKVYTAFFFIFCLFFVCMFYILKKQYKLAITIGFISALGGLAGTALLCFLMGGIKNFIGIYQHEFFSTRNNPYAIEFQNGAWYGMGYLYWIMNQVNTVLCGFGIIFILFGKKLHKFCDIKYKPFFYFLTFLLFSFTALTTIKPYVMNIRYVLPVYSGFFMIGGFAFCIIIKFIDKYFRQHRIKYFILPIIWIIVGISALKSYSTFLNLFVHHQTLDTSIGLIKRTLNTPAAR